MDVVKKNIFSIVCGVIAILAIVASFWPVGGEIATLQTDTQTHAADYSAVTSLISKPRHFPLTDPSQSSPADLTTFPNAKVIETGKAATDQISADSRAMLSEVVEMNHKANPLLVPDALPAPLTDSPRFRFRDLYKIVLSDDPTAGRQSDPTGPVNLQNDILHGGMPPLPADITAASAKLWNDVYKSKIITVNNQPVNAPDVQAKFQEATLKLPDQMRLDVTKTHKMYVEPNALAAAPNVAGQNGAPAPADIWFAQLGLWVQQNACLGLAEANRDATNVLDAPVKHLNSLTASGNYTMSGPPTGSTPVEGGDVIAVPKVTTISPHGPRVQPVVRCRAVLNVDRRGSGKDPTSAGGHFPGPAR